MSIEESSSPEHILIPRAAIPPDQALAFELFVKVADRFVKVANRFETIDTERINRYLEHERDILYIERASLENFMNDKFEEMHANVRDINLHIEKRFEWYTRCLELGFVDLKIVSQNSEKFHRVDLLIQSSFEFFRARDLRKHLIRYIFKSVEHRIARRAILGTCLSLSIILDQSETTAATFRSLFMGSLFRDLALRDSPDGDPHDFNEFTDASSLMEFQSHPIKSMEILRQFGLVDDIIQAVVEQHHERPRGDGFPRGLKRVETYQPAQYLGLADFVVTEMNRMKFAKGFIKKEVLLEHLKQVMPEENHKNLPLILRAVGDAFE